MSIVKIPAYYYQQFDADYSLDVPAEGFGGWKKADLEINLDKTAVVVMHAWDCGIREQYPGWYNTVEYIPRANDICSNIFPRLLRTVRNSSLKVFHVAVQGEYLERYPGYGAAVKLAGNGSRPLDMIEGDPVVKKLWEFRSDYVVPGTNNKRDVSSGFKNLDFAKEARPLEHEGIAANAEQLFALCREQGVNHLVYAGFAINGCLLVSPGGIIDMGRRGLMCSAIRQAVTAIENKETARNELGKELGLWFVSIISGFVYDIDDFIDGILSSHQ